MPGRVSDEQRAKILDAVRIGAHPQVACTAAGLSKSFFHNLRYRARRNEPDAVEFLSAIEQAESGSEVEAIAASHRAIQPIDDGEVYCQTCGKAAVVDSDTIAALAMRIHDNAKAKSLAADVALKTLERRHPKRWSQKVVHTIAEEHDRLLSVCERVLAPEVFESLLEEYLSEGEGSGEAGSGSGGQAGDGIH
jgi:predicted house-cleaning NTP pyrophosphatase (Maf/HAM1 superfamily)